ncbi:MAG: exodeoxyribonuclease VII small subunit [Solobacterium sp.]|nr:exodeoxyribonuclease VII small subunit [Solobacterium sp.]MDY2952925.1 exodeoxyribonuclease VII small subunit [Erysipelotrichaceae bacterium]MCI6695839.1 exodeoxyribonuclease VII small subunit [Solobacterium sp.]MDD5801551.1 exodeoxyribonuclease VII small subunit [Solobacterium sp.]MDD7775674.1 exodeoxyribonuclease VII small subunit [Solobacterium sp.]
MAKLKFEDKMKRLQEIVDLLDSSDIELDKSISLYKEGLELSKELKEQLSAYEEKIEELKKDE